MKILNIIKNEVNILFDGKPNPSQKEKRISFVLFLIAFGIYMYVHKILYYKYALNDRYDLYTVYFWIWSILSSPFVILPIRHMGG